jgi:predicted nucleotidyltransferase
MLHRRSFGSVEITSVDRPALLAALRERVAALAQQRPEVERVLLFGSFARGDATPESDVDLLLIARQADANPLKRADRYREAFADLPFDVWIQVFTPDEVDRRTAGGDPFLRNVLAGALALWG